jgi:hypothetical protein
MSTFDDNFLNNAETVIERFGGIRPMSNKTDIAVTTIQGWKKRGAIPANRAKQIIAAADENGIDLSDLLGGTGAHEPQRDKASGSKFQDILDSAQSERSAKSKSDTFPVKHTGKSGSQQIDHNEVAALKARLAEVEQQAVKKSIFISMLMIGIGLGAVAILMWPKAKQVEDRLHSNHAQLAHLADDVNAMKSESAAFGGLLPEDWKQQIQSLTEQSESLREQAMMAQQKVGEALKMAQSVSSDVLGEHGGTLPERITKLQNYAAEFMGNPNLAGFMGHISGLTGHPDNSGILDIAQFELTTLLGQFNGTPDQLNSYLQAARAQSAPIAETFQNVPTNDLKAATMLFAFNQMRSALNRNNQPFTEDLALLKNFIGEDNTELHMAIDKLAPHAESGVLTISGLSGEFRSIAGDAVVASLQGENGDVRERTRARMNELFSIEKNGELLTGTEAQAKLLQTQKHLDNGDLDSAIATAQSLDPQALEAVQPWLKEAEKTRTALDLKSILDANIDLRAFGLTQNINDVSLDLSAIGDAVQGYLPSGGRMIEDPKSGLKIYLPARSVNIAGGARPSGTGIR